MKHDIRRMALAAVIPLFLLFILLHFKVFGDRHGLELHTTGSISDGTAGRVRNFRTSTGTQQFQASVRQYDSTLFPDVVSVLFLPAYSPYIFFAIWIGCGALTFLIGKPGWHIGASGIIYGLAFFLFFSGILRKHVPLIAISLLITFLYGGLVWNMFPQFAKATTSWEGHLSGAIAGTLCAIGFMEYGPQRPDPFAGEEDEEEDEDEENNEDEDDKKEEKKDEDSSTRIE